MASGMEQAGRDLEASAHEKCRGGSQHPYKVTQWMQEGGWLETSGCVTRIGFLYLFYRQEDAERKKAVVCVSKCHSSQYRPLSESSLSPHTCHIKPKWL